MKPFLEEKQSAEILYPKQEIGKSDHYMFLYDSEKEKYKVITQYFLKSMENRQIIKRYGKND